MKKLLLMGALTVAGGAFAFELVGPSSRAQIVLASAPEESSRLAAQELADYVFKITGTRLKIEISRVRPSERPYARTVFIGTLGTLADIPVEARKALAATGNTEASWTGVKDGALWIVGKEEVAELYATYHFIEKELGVRWFQAATKEDPGEYVPKAETLTVPDFTRFREPYFSFRHLSPTGCLARPPATNGVACAIRNGLQTLPAWHPVPFGKPDSPFAYFIPRVPRRAQPLGGGHLAFESAMEGNRHFKEHPEWFALVDGQRTDGGEHMRQYCQSNPEVRRRVTEFILRKLRENNGLGRFLFGDVDTPHGACECAACVAMDGAMDRAPTVSRRSRTTRFVKVVNDICGKVFAEFPDADLWMWAYSTYRELPQDGVKPDPRLKLYFCTHERCYGHALDDPNCPRNVRMHGLLNGWRKLLPRVAVYEYLNCTPNEYTPNERVQAHDIKLFKTMPGFFGWKEEMCFSDAGMYGTKEQIAARRQRPPSNWQWYYTTGHLLWDPDLDLDALLEDAESKYYGPAYPAMKKYQALRRKLWNNHPAHLGYSTGDQRRPVLLNRAGAKEELLGLLDEADKMLATSNLQPSTSNLQPYRFRIARDRKWLNDFWIKPNAEIQALRGKTLRIPKAKTPPAIDGNGTDDAWVSAYYATNFARSGTEKNPKPIPAALFTSVGVLYDEANLYFLLTAKEPLVGKIRARTERGADVWADDGFEIFLFPPSVENACYHLAVNPKGNLWAATAGRVQKNAYGAVAKGRIGADGYVIELKVPLKDIAPIRPGEAWKIHFGRNRTISENGVLKDGEGNYAYDGVGYMDVLAYRPAEFGAPYLRNGSFEDVDAKGALKGWEKPYGGEIVSTPRGNVLKMKAGQCILQTMWHGELRQQPHARKMRYSLRASGKGTLKVWFRRWCDTDDPKMKHGYRRATLEPSFVGGTYELTAEPKTYVGEHEIPANEWHSICVSCAQGEVTLDDIIVEGDSK